MTKSTTVSAVSHSPSPSLSSSPSFRLLSHLTLPQQQQPDLNNNNNNTNAFEFHESDVVWSPSSSSDDDASELPSPSPSPSPSHASTSPPLHRHNTSGLYAALSDDQLPSVRRKPAVTPSQSAATAARTIPPVTVRRSSEHSPGFHQSAPVNVPVWLKNKSSGYLGFDDVVDDVAEEEDDNNNEMVPPHEIVARSYVTFSVFEGAGRTLKGRDMCLVRNAVFRKTGSRA
ncbi:putative senescence regulator S40 [Helianthus annuus]|nr:putative senescence regulator S40 [Helianthus annuus]